MDTTERIALATMQRQLADMTVGFIALRALIEQLAARHAVEQPDPMAALTTLGADATAAAPALIPAIIPAPQAAAIRAALADGIDGVIDKACGAAAQLLARAALDGDAPPAGRA